MNKEKQQHADDKPVKASKDKHENASPSGRDRHMRMAKSGIDSASRSERKAMLTGSEKAKDSKSVPVDEKQEPESRTVSVKSRASKVCKIACILA